MFKNLSKIENLKMEMEKFTLDKIKKISDRVEKQDRIIKFSADSPTFRIKTKEWVEWTDEESPFGIISFSPHVVIATNLYLYIDKEEYVITLKELRSKSVNEEDCKLKVDCNLAYFDVRSYSEKESYATIYKFVIDYVDGKYVVSIF